MVRFGANSKKVVSFLEYGIIWTERDNMNIDRYLSKLIENDLKEKMVFIGGPRQVGKTTLAKKIGDTAYAGRTPYLNWDARGDRKAVMESAFDGKARLVIFDEIHKYRHWKNYLKGLYDKRKEEIDILVTGSSRLDIFRKGGDSLLGRYFYYRLHPLSVGELCGNRKVPEPFKDFMPAAALSAAGIYKRLRKFGGFPEMYMKQSATALRRWHNNRIDRLVKEDIRDIESVRDLSGLQVLTQLLPGKVGSLLSLNSLTEDLQVSFKTVRLWVDILERFYYHFRIYPYQSTLIKSLRKEPKLYLWDWSELQDEGAALENMTASHLLKLCHFLYDAQGHKAQLWFLRDKQQREVDFLVTVGGKPWFCVEVKKDQDTVSGGLLYFKDRLKVPMSFQVVEREGVDVKKQGVRIISVSDFLSCLV